MQVHVFVSEASQDGEPTYLLILPDGPAPVVPRHLKSEVWRHFALLDSSDPLIGLSPGEVEVAIANDRYLLLSSELTRLAWRRALATE